MPAKAGDLERVARKLGFVKTRQKGSHVRWKHPDGRATTIPVHPSTEIGGWLFQEILSQLGVSEASPSRSFAAYCDATPTLSPLEERPKVRWWSRVRGGVLAVLPFALA